MTKINNILNTRKINSFCSTYTSILIMNSFKNESDTTLGTGVNNLLQGIKCI